MDQLADLDIATTQGLCLFHHVYYLYLVMTTMEARKESLEKEKVVSGYFAFKSSLERPVEDSHFWTPKTIL